MGQSEIADADVTPESQVVLAVRDLSVHYRSDGATVRAVDGVSFDIAVGERLAVVGESGSGKSTLAMALLRLIRPPGRIVDGSIRLAGQDILTLDGEAMRKLRLSQIALIPQGAMNSLNPVLRVDEQIRDGIRDHGGEGDITDRVARLLVSVGLGSDVSSLFPHELSGGMKQRVAIAIAISNQPKLIVADEPTSALDVVVQRQIIETLLEIQGRLGAAVILVGHDMGLIAQFADRIAVMYAGRLVELGPTRDVLRAARHPYSELLIRSVPTLARRLDRLVAIPGAQPSLADLPAGCAFQPRCPRVIPRCRTLPPTLAPDGAVHAVACYADSAAQ